MTSLPGTPTHARVSHGPPPVLAADDGRRSPAATPSCVVLALPGGSAITVRSIHRGDRDLLLDHFAHLGADARYRRFLAPVQHLTAEQLDYLTDPDHRRHEALFALDDGHPVGVARYISSSGDPRTAEIAVAVIDGWRGRGVGGALVDELARRARRAGVDRFVALMLADNRAMHRILAGLGSVRVLDRSGGSVEVAVALGP